MLARKIQVRKIYSDKISQESKVLDRKETKNRGQSLNKHIGQIQNLMKPVLHLR